MRRLLIILLVAVAAAGCESKRKAALERQQAYQQGEQQALQSGSPAGVRQLVVYVQGPVRNNVVPWSDGMLLSQAIVNAYYTGFMNPMVVRVIRNGQTVVDFKGIDLLHHEDAPVQPGDIIQIIE